MPAPGHFWSGAGCLDGSEFYDPAAEYQIADANSHTVKLDDSPGVTIGSFSGELTISAVDYIRFKPGLAADDGNIYVTLGIVNWNAHGRYNDWTSTMTANEPPAATGPDNSNNFPEWECEKEE